MIQTALKLKTSRLRLPVFLLGVAVVSLWACERGEPSDGTQLDPFRETTTVHVRAAEGGTVTAQGGGATLTIPPGALSEDVDITVRGLPMDHGAATAIYEFGPDGLRFVRPATLRVMDPLVVAPEGKMLAVALFGGAEFAPLSDSAVVEHGAAAPIHHFSRYSLIFVDAGEMGLADGGNVDGSRDDAASVDDGGGGDGGRDDAGSDGGDVGDCASRSVDLTAPEAVLSNLEGLFEVSPNVAIDFATDIKGGYTTFATSNGVGRTTLHLTTEARPCGHLRSMLWAAGSREIMFTIDSVMGPGVYAVTSIGSSERSVTCAGAGAAGGGAFPDASVTIVSNGSVRVEGTFSIAWMGHVVKGTFDLPRDVLCEAPSSLSTSCCR